MKKQIALVLSLIHISIRIPTSTPSEYRTAWNRITCWTGDLWTTRISPCLNLSLIHILAVDFKVQTRQGSERIARAAFEFARKNGKKNVTIVTKANIVKLADGNFIKAVRRVGEEYPEIEIQERLVEMCIRDRVSIGSEPSTGIYAIFTAIPPTGGPPTTHI